MKPNELSTFPSVIYRQYKDYYQTTDARAKHQLLLECLQSVHSHFLAILLGVYRSNSLPNLPTEETLYRHSRSNKKHSFGIFVETFRDLPNEIKERYNFQAHLPKTSELVHQFNLLKIRIIHQGHDENLQERLQLLLKGMNAGKKEYIDGLNTIVELRNIFVHKEGQAKYPDSDLTRDWPLTQEYFELMNPLLFNVLKEWCTDFHSMISTCPILIKNLNIDNGEASFIKQQGTNRKTQTEPLSSAQIEICKSHQHIIVENDVTLPYYYQRIPSIPPNVYRQIAEKIEAKMMTKVLKNNIKQRLSRNNPLSTLDRLVLENEAKSHHISKTRLDQLIESEQSKQSTVQPPPYEQRFNIWWLRYFAMQHDTTVRPNWKTDPENITGMQHALWTECCDYLDYIKRQYLDNDTVSWSLKSTNFQQGAMSKIFWGQLYLTEGVFKDALSVGFAVSYANKYFSGVKTKNKDIRNRKAKSSVLLWPSFYNNVVEDMGSLGHQLLIQLYKYGNELLEEYQDIFEDLKCIVLSPSPNEDMYLFNTWNQSDTHFDTVTNFFNIPSEERQPLARVLSPFITLDDLVKDGQTDYQALQSLEDLISTLIPIFSTIVIRCNAWAQSQGISQEWLRSRRIEMGQLQKEIAREIQAAINEDPSMNPSDLAKEIGFQRGLSPFRIEGNLMGSKYKKLL